ncbi:zinc finger SWIM domain-containing protein 1 isoform X2 [Patella vulgata]|uniref:zinc finger SWIM domain-containing protein 1 isoform X2 n=1 Tax=Patella vulgata TaxID=6465 RepID=UPI0024A84E41|nr:zinc finger SWIM domain-containing protein 1 isoform X2 [Patella vulgata]
MKETKELKREWTFRDGCNSLIKFKLVADKLVVHQLDTCHNHPVNEDWFQHLPKRRKFSGEEMTEISNVLQVQPNKKILQDHIRKTTRICTTLRDLSNLTAKLDPKYSDLSDLLSNLESNKTLEVLADEDGTLRAIYYQDEVMKKKYDLFPELIIADATYKLNDMRMPVFLQMVVDGNGESEIVSVFVLVTEDGDTMNYLLDLFKGNNPAWERTQTILTDNDFTERGIYSEKFPAAKLQLCLFHVLRSMKREINCEKMGIRVEEKNLCIELIQKLAYSTNEEEYEINRQAIVQTNIQPVIDYINNSWHDIRDQWVIGLKNSCHYSNNTSNRVESINQKIKQVITKFSNLKKFFDDLELVIRCLRQERDSRITNVIMKRNSSHYPRDDPKSRFAALLTPYAYQVVRKQMELADKLKVSGTDDNTVSMKTTAGMANVTSTSCTCQFTSINQLPCRHIFAFRKMKKMYLFFETGISRRWTLEFYVNMTMSTPSARSGNTTNNNVTLMNGPVVLSQTQKYRVAFREAQKLATLASEGSTQKYKQRLNVLQKLVQLWKEDKEAMVYDMETNDMKPVHQCVVCHKTFLDYSQLETHNQIHVKDEKIDDDLDDVDRYCDVHFADY